MFHPISPPLSLQKNHQNLRDRSNWSTTLARASPCRGEPASLTVDLPSCTTSWSAGRAGSRPGPTQSRSNLKARNWRVACPTWRMGRTTISESTLRTLLVLHRLLRLRLLSSLALHSVSWHFGMIYTPLKRLLMLFAMVWYFLKCCKCCNFWEKEKDSVWDVVLFAWSLSLMLSVSFCLQTFVSGTIDHCECIL